MPPLKHPFAPVFDEHSRVLILGTFPSVRSRESGFYYGHPQNRFWKLLAVLTKTEPLPTSIGAKKQLLLENEIALWDVVASCEIRGSSDLSIGQVVPNDVSIVLKNSPIRRIFTNGDKAHRLYGKFWAYPIERLPSTSPANASYSFSALLERWKVLLPYLKKVH
jgi:hypoxanthine-DNA glycosylase